MPPITAACENALDIIAVIDSSSTVSDEEFGQMISFLMSYVERFTISEDGTRFGVVRFGNQADTVVGLGADTNLDSLQQSIGDIQHVSQSGNNIAAGIAIATEEFTINGRFSAPQVMLVFTDGQSDSLALTAQSASQASRRGIQLFSVGIGDSVLQSELEAIASDPDVDHVFNVNDFASINTILSALVEGACNGRNSNCEELLCI